MAEVEKLTGHLGGLVHGFQPSDVTDEASAAFLRAALAEHRVLVLPDLHMTHEQQAALTKVFGAPMQLPYVTPIESDPNVIAVLKEADERATGVFGGEWHSDFSFLPNPPAGSVLNAVEIPPFGGDTAWSCQVTAYASLPGYLKELVDTRSAIHVGKPYGVKFAPPESARANSSVKMSRGDPDADREIAHPSVVTDPETGQRMLFLNPIYTTRFDGMTEEQSRPFLEQIYKHAIRPDFSMRHKWSAGDVVIWDNRATLHYATNDYDGYRRLLYRTTYSGAPPR